MSAPKVAVEGQGRDARIRRQSRALAQLAQRLWRSGEGLQSALSAITETAAHVLSVECVKVWKCESGGGMRCVHSYELATNVHNPSGFDRQLLEVGVVPGMGPPTSRVIRTCESIASEVGSPLWLYMLGRHIESLIESPVRVGDELYGAVHLEHVGDVRVWRRDELAFADQMRDFVALALEIERRTIAEARVVYLELHDPTTGLANRTWFYAAINDLLRRQRKRPRLASLLFVSIDRFNSVNERVGEMGGDVTLMEIGERIIAATPDEAVIARVESDCFAVLLPRLAHEWQATQQAEQILEALEQPLHIDDLDFSVSASIGIAFNQGETASTAETLLRDADMASKQAQQLGRNRCEIFDPELHRGLLDRLQIEYGLREAMRNNSLVVVYQPVIDLADHSVIAAEALLRWRDADGVLRSAFEFIDVAETSGLIVPIGKTVLQQGCTDANHWPARSDGRQPGLAVNLSARQFEQPGLVAMVTEVLRETGFPAQRLCLEITETTLMSRAQDALDTLHALKALGVSLAVDDFGTGYSSLAYLQRFPVDMLKIDKSLIDHLPADPHAQAIVAAVLGLARALEMGVIVEGVEHASQEAALREMGCQHAQGWLFAKGEPNADFVARLSGQC
ncbi:MAG: sensor domain-containing phosphodiesterase [Lysobacteraceae bacterium]